MNGISTNVAIEADKIACYIRYKCGKMNRLERQMCAKKELSNLSEDKAKLVKLALEKRSKQTIKG